MEIQQATEKQKAFATKLGINFPSNISSKDLSAFIDAKVGSKNQQSERLPSVRNDEHVKTQASIIAQTLTKCWADLNSGKGMEREMVLETYEYFFSKLYV